MDVISYALSKKYTDEKNTEWKVKIAGVEKELNNFKSVINQVNVNQEAKQLASGYGIVSLPKNAANGQVSVSVKGRTLKNELNYNRDTWAEWEKFAGVQIVNGELEFTTHDSDNQIGSLTTKLKNNTTYGLLLNIPYSEITDITMMFGSNLTGEYEIFFKSPYAVGNKKHIFTTTTIANNMLRLYMGRVGSNGKVRIKDIRIFELPTGSEIETDFNTMTADQLAQKYPYINGDSAKSTVSAMRLKSVGKNLFDGELENGSLDPQGQPADMLDRLRSKNFIRVKNNEKITLSSSSGAALSYVDFYFYDINKRFISCVTTGATMTTTPSNCSFVKFRLATIDDVLSLNYGSQGFYEPYTESNAYVVAKDKNGNIAELRSLENETKDEIRVSGGKAELVKRIDDLILDGSLDWAVLISSEGVKKIRTSIPVNASLGSKNTRATYKETQLIFNTTQAIANLKPGEYFTLTTSGIRYFYIAIDDLDSGWVNPPTKQDMKNFFNANPITLTYQLAEPEIIPIQVSGSLTSHPNGTVFIEPIVADAGVYTDKIEVLHDDLPIKAIEKVSKVDFMTGVETELDIEGMVIAENQLSFTHPDLLDGDIVFFEYEYDREGTTPETEIEYYDSRYTIKDSVTDKFYKWEVTVADGVPSIGLVEV